MVSRTRSLVILGASGDLTARLLLPGLGELLAERDDLDLELLGLGGEEFTDEQWRRRVLEAFEKTGTVSDRVREVVQGSRYTKGDATSPDDLQKLLDSCTGTPSLYFALPPAVTEKSVAALADVALPEGSSLALEKPFGTDLPSAKALNLALARLVPESQVHRVDHFIGKSTVLNLLGLRFANRIFEQSWNAENVERVEIVFDESLALENRAGYYDHAGALVDMIQSHLLQVLALIAMEPPSSLDPEDLRGGMALALRATRVWNGDAVEASRRARYSAGEIDGRQLGAYVDEPGVVPERATETLAQVTLAVENWRWAGVPFVLRSGKALQGTRKEATITFRPVPHLPTGLTGPEEPSRLRIGLSPQNISLDLRMNGEGDPFTLDPITLDAVLGEGQLGPYGEVIAGILEADPTLSVRGDVAEECWRIVTPVLDAWRSNAVPLEEYPAGSTGPEGWS